MTLEGCRKQSCANLLCKLSELKQMRGCTQQSKCSDTASSTITQSVYTYAQERAEITATHTRLTGSKKVISYPLNLLWNRVESSSHLHHQRKDAPHLGKGLVHEESSSTNMKLARRTRVQNATRNTFLSSSRVQELLRKSQFAARKKSRVLRQ